VTDLQTVSTEPTRTPQLDLWPGGITLRLRAQEGQLLVAHLYGPQAGWLLFPRLLAPYVPLHFCSGYGSPQIGRRTKMDARDFDQRRRILARRLLAH
jgi:hypothetical protein